ncbi:hypothetical protein HZH68_004058 [Vespula germanica]|uniref:Fatty acid synthase n=1 Tax=Vespula germanica TaxID=30212 RepID=A0A834KPI0_VESGE|nr:hypothetical protein HZH68_004058 [Vespula germanica]
MHEVAVTENTLRFPEASNEEEEKNNSSTPKIVSVMKTILGNYFLKFEQAHTLDSMSRMLLVRTYEATVDAGFISECIRRQLYSQLYVPPIPKYLCFTRNLMKMNRLLYRFYPTYTDICLLNFCLSYEIFSWTVPDSWSLEDAATVPCVYCTSIAAPHINGEMQKGERTLIHTSSGGIGQAAINLVLPEGCEVFTTVDTSEKRRFLKETIFCIDDRHTEYSRYYLGKIILQLISVVIVDSLVNS